MNKIIKFLIKHWGYKLHADTIYIIFKAIPIDEFIIYAQQYADYCGRILKEKEVN